MESVDSSPNYTRPRSRFDPKKEISPGGSECDEIMSVASSTCGSAVNKPHARKLTNNGIKYRTSNKKNFGGVGSFRRRAKPRIIQSPTPISDEEEETLLDSSDASPHYLKATTSSEGKKSRSQASPCHSESTFDGSDTNASRSSQPKLALSRTSSLRNVRILIKRAIVKPKRSLLRYSEVSEDVCVDRATYSSTIKDSKFPAPVVLHQESGKSSAMRVCRYHHCSLHGGCQGGHDPAPPPKRFLYKRKQSMRKQKSAVPKTETRHGVKVSSDRKRSLHKNQIVSVVESSNQERLSDSVAVSGVGNEIGVVSNEGNYPNEETELFKDGYKDVRVSYLVELAFGETSFPERSYEGSLDISRKYTSEEQDLGGVCSKCSCHNREEATTTPKRVEADLICPREATALSLELKNNKEVPQNGSAVVLGISSVAPFEKPKESVADEAAGKDGPDTSVVFDEISGKRSGCSSASTSTNSEEDAESIIKSPPAEDSRVDEAARVEDSETNTPTHNGATLHFSKPRHVSMWHLIHQHMSSNVSAESTNKPVQEGDGLDSKESTTDADTGTVTTDSDTQEIELRKLFAVKLVREAIEKILLPEVQDQSSDDQSVSSESTPRACIYAESDADRENENVLSDPKTEAVVTADASGGEIKEAEKEVARKSEKKAAPKHWSNLKKWILLQRFIRELEKVRRFNPKKPRHLPLNPDPEAEKVSLRPQTVDERKSAEEWMLDHALRQAVSQLAPTQKKKVALLVKAFETVVPLQEESQVRSKTPRLRSSGSLAASRVSIFDSPISKARSLNLDVDGNVRNVMENETETAAVAMVNVKDSSLSNKMERKKHIKMWHMIYQHVVSDIAEKVGGQLFEGGEDDEAEDEHASSNLRSGLTKSDALKLVKEAVDEILVPEMQDDSSDTRSDTNDSVQELDVVERDSNEIGGESTPKDEELRAESKATNWIKLKKLILLKRSIKALEKARKFRPQPPQLLPQISDLEREKVDLRQQMMDERKKAEQWMLDYAVQHIVTTLTPARKRRVSMLVEAFEAVVPLPEI